MQAIVPDDQRPVRIRQLMPKGTYRATLDRITVFADRETYRNDKGEDVTKVVVKLLLKWHLEGQTTAQGEEIEIEQRLNLPRDIMYTPTAKFFKGLSEITGTTIDRSNATGVSIDIVLRDGTPVQSWGELAERLLTDEAASPARVTSLTFQGEELIGARRDIRVIQRVNMANNTVNEITEFDRVEDAAAPDLHGITATDDLPF